MMENTIFEEFENEESMEDDEVDLSQAEDIDVEKNFEQVRFNCTDTLKLYLQEIGQYSLLSKEDETLLFNKYEASKKARERLVIIETNDNDTTPIEEYNALLHVVEVGEIAKEKIINSNLRLAVAIAKKYYSNASLSLQDLIQEANLGLIKATEKFDITKGYRFSTYATCWIKMFISRGLATYGRTIRLPQYMVEKISKLNGAKRFLRNTLNREADIQELCEYLGMNEKQILYLEKIQSTPLSLDKKVSGKDEDKEVFGDFVADTSSNGLEYSTRNGLNAKINEVLNTLSARERDVIILHFGLNGNDSITLEEIGVKWGITKQRVKQIEVKAIRKLQHPSRSKQLMSFVK